MIQGVFFIYFIMYKYLFLLVFPRISIDQKIRRAMAVELPRTMMTMTMTMTMMMMAVKKVLANLILLAAVAGLSARVAAAAGAGGIYVYAPDLSDFDTVELCSDKCVGVKSSFFETVCEDGGPFNGTDYPGSACALGTDCSACGPVTVLSAFDTMPFWRI